MRHKPLFDGIDRSGPVVGGGSTRFAARTNQWELIGASTGVIRWSLTYARKHNALMSESTTQLVYAQIVKLPCVSDLVITLQLITVRP